MYAPSPLDRSTRLRLVPAATRTLGGESLISVGGATGSVKRLMGSGPELWRAFGRGETIAEVVSRLSDNSATSEADIDAHVTQFAAALIKDDLAEVAC